jgi:hypothetical protein
MRRGGLRWLHRAMMRYGGGGRGGHIGVREGGGCNGWG